jgi:hypothetical protein
MEIRLRSNGAVMYEGELRQYLRENNGPSFDRLTPEVLEALQADPVFEGPQAQPGRYQVAFRDGVEQQSDGKWYTKYSVADMDDETKAAKNVEQAKNVRDDRNCRLADSDWTQGKDIADSVSTPWAAYRQALRDVPAQAGFPWDIQWPNKPE